ncbi:MAG: hypothetical protein KJZ65_12235 [Phycisphaerales bacterium]|nr:hypothetical protein [Phycisphaerales bacterium]
MPRFTLACGRLLLEIDSDVGAGISDFSVLSPSGDPTPLLRRAPERGFGSEQMGCFLMAPWTNRLRHARFDWQGRTHQLNVSHTDGTAMHGDVRERAWQIRHRTPMSATLEFNSHAHVNVNFPFPFRCTVRYEVAPGGVEADLNLTNTGEEDMPAGCGFHPYFMRRLWSDEDVVELRVPVSGRYPCEGCLPTMQARREQVCDRLNAGGAFGDLDLDDVFTVDRLEAEVSWPSSGVRARMIASDWAGHVVIYTPRAAPGTSAPRSWFCVEPTTMVNDGFNLAAAGWQGTGVRTCRPGETLSLHWDLRIAFE